MRRNDMDTALRRVRDNRHADLLFNIVSNRSQQNSTIITTNRPFAEWGEALSNAACLVALVDRLARNTEILAINGDSYRRRGRPRLVDGCRGDAGNREWSCR